MAGQSTAGRAVRRQERALTAEQALEVIDATDHAVLATADLAGNPYAVPVTPVRVGRTLYFHHTAAPGGRLEDNMEMNPRVCLCFTGKALTVPKLFTVDYASALAFGRAEIVTDPVEKARAMAAIVSRHAPGNSPQRNAVQFQNRLEKVAVWKVAVESVTGKARAAKVWKKGKTLREPVPMPPQPWLAGLKD